MSAHINPNVFLIFTPDGIVLWDFEKHNQYSLAPEYTFRLVDIAYKRYAIARDDKIDIDLQGQNIIAEHPFSRPEWGWDILARIFHVGTKDIPQEMIPINGREWASCHTALCIETAKNRIPPFKQPRSTAILSLPRPDPAVLNSKTLWQSLLERRTCRKFRQEKISLQTLSTILYASFGFLDEREPGINEFVPKYLRQRRSSPSGGGLNSTEVYLFCNRVSDLGPGTYHYDPVTHGLTSIRETARENVLPSLLMGQYFSAELAFGVFIAGRFDRMWWKYGHSRAYRVSLLDVGHLSQTFQLVSTACGLKTWLSAAFRDSEVEELLEIKSPAEQVLLFVGAGYSDGEDIDTASREILTEYSMTNAHET
ncbi:SagB/ThcOx family dehydrogenase [Cupriavidus sp. amp6]|uniref:SagB/ThcOx family dehydrogenase n=1 Tax=Cupriavidus sp. amp6 TaxID=388051 RepID=UPI000565F049|nr:SagB/ThcOx family dehydrogenase [Cupriavidus sp. amp6]